MVHDLTKMVELGQDLREYIIDNPILEGLDLSETPRFYSGIDWFNNIYEDESDTVSITSSDIDDDSDIDTPDSLTECSSDEDETRVSPETVKSKVD